MALPGRNTKNDNNQSPRPTLTATPRYSYPISFISPPNPSGSNIDPSSSSPNPPPMPEERNVSIVNRKPAKTRYGQDALNPSLYHQQPPIRKRVPYNLHNKQKAGVPYKSCACITVKDNKLMNALLDSQQALLIEVLLCMYHFRMNNVHSAGAMSQSEIKALFEIEICEYPFSCHELYKRYAMRRGKLYGKEVDDLNFWNLPTEEMNSWTAWLAKCGTFRYQSEEAQVLWNIGKDVNGLPVLKLAPCEFTLNYIQLFNAMHDNLYQWKCALFGVEYIRRACHVPAFYLSKLHFTFITFVNSSYCTC